MPILFVSYVTAIELRADSFYHGISNLLVLKFVRSMMDKKKKTCINKHMNQNMDDLGQWNISGVHAFQNEQGGETFQW